MKRIVLAVIALLAIGSAFAQTKFPLTIICNVMDADVYIDNNLYMKTSPNMVIQLPPTTYNIKVAKAGFNEFSASVAVKASRSGTTLNVNLQPLAAPQTISPAQSLLPSFPLNVTSNVGGAQVFLNGKFSGTTPFGSRVIGGDYEVRVTAPGYQDFFQRLRVRNPTQVNAQLQSTGSQLTVQSNVNGADVYINGNPAGKTPFQAQLPNGSYNVVVRAPGFSDFSQSVVINGGNFVVNATLQGMSQQLSVLSNVNGAEVFINGNPAGRTPFAAQLPAGSYALMVRAPGYMDFNQSVVIGNGPAQVNAMLQGLSYQVSIESNIRGALVLVNGTQVGQTPFVSMMPMGNYAILVRAPGYSDYQAQIAVNGNQSINAFLQPMLASWQLRLPEGILNREGRQGQSRDRDIQVFVDGILQADARGPIAAAGQLAPGRHVIRIVSGGLAIEGQVDVQSGKSYVFEPFAGINAK
jgi:hypothetical protein